MQVGLIGIIAPVFICAAIGFGWARMKHAYHTEFVTNLVMNVGTPCLVFTTLSTVALDLATFGTMAGLAALTLVVAAVIGAAGLRAAGLSVRSYLTSIVVGNAGNMGLPLCLLAFGEPGLALAIGYFAVSALLHHTIGIGIVSGATSLGRLARIPVIYAVLAALPFMVWQAAPPAWLLNTTRILGGMVIPLMLITLGISLARLGVASFRRSLVLSLVRLGLGFAVGVTIAEAFSLEGTTRGVLILEASMPTAVFNYLFALRYGRAPDEVAGLVVVSTAISFATLPLLLWYVL